MKTKATREEVLAKFKAAKERKRTCVAEMEQHMRQIYKERTGKEAECFFVM